VAERCDGAVDDDCDGAIDDGFQVTVFDPVSMSALTAAQPACTGPGSTLDVCLTAAKRYCVSRTEGCYLGGAGLLSATPSSARVACFGTRAVEIATTFDEVSARSGTSVTTLNIGTRVAHSAVNRFCRDAATGGYEAGIGPIEHSYPTLFVTCLPAGLATFVSLPTADLRARGCDPIVDPDRIECATAADGVCRDRGHEAGFGPVEWNTTDSAVVCLGG
jgi:hypothetical protein